MPAVEYNPFPDVGGCAKLPWFAGLRFTVSLRIGVIFLAAVRGRFSCSRKTADFLGDRSRFAWCSAATRPL